MDKIRGAFDVGKEGAFIVFKNEDIIIKSIMPKTGNQIDLRDLAEMIRQISEQYDNIHLVIEDVHAIFGASAKSTFNFGWALGILEGMLVMAQIPYTKVAPKEWQREVWQGIKPVYKSGGKSVDTKSTSLLAAKRLFPLEDFRKSERAEKPHDGVVDALLMAEYCRRKY